MDDKNGFSSKFQDVSPDILDMAIRLVAPKAIEWMVRGIRQGLRHNRNPLAGDYELLSFSSALVTGGRPLEPPAVSGTLSLGKLSQRNRSHGTFSMAVTVPDGLGGKVSFTDDGTYTAHGDRTWEQEGQMGMQVKGRVRAREQDAHH